MSIHDVTDRATVDVTTQGPLDAIAPGHLAETDPGLVVVTDQAPSTVALDESLDASQDDIIDFTLRAGDNGTVGNLEAAAAEGDSAYESMSAAEIRRLCTRRGLKMPSNSRKDARIAALRKFDSIAAAYLEAMGRDIPTGNGGRQPRRTRGCMFRVINLLFSNEFSSDFAATGDTLTREQLDGAQPARVAFWRRFASAFATDRADTRELIAADEMFEGVDLSVVVPHEGPKLQEMWKEVNSAFVTASARFRQSGTHVNDFKQFVHGRADVLYLWHWLKVKPGLTDFVHGGMFAEDEFDSLQSQLHPNRQSLPGVGGRGSSETTPSKRRAGDRTPTKYKRAKVVAKQVEQTREAIQAMSRSVETYLTSRREAQDRAVGGTAMSTATERAAAFRLLDDLRSRIEAIQDELQTAAEGDETRLQEDLELCLRERQLIMQRLGYARASE